jgi:hypothetical protein
LQNRPNVHGVRCLDVKPVCVPAKPTKGPDP